MTATLSVRAPRGFCFLLLGPGAPWPLLGGLPVTSSHTVVTGRGLAFRRAHSLGEPGKWASRPHSTFSGLFCSPVVLAPSLPCLARPLPEGCWRDHLPHRQRTCESVRICF